MNKKTDSSERGEAIRNYERLAEEDLDLADDFVVQAAGILGYEKVIWHFWRFHRFERLEPIRIDLFQRFSNGEELGAVALECLHYLQEQRRTGDPSCDAALRCQDIYAELLRDVVRTGRRGAILRNLVWQGLIEKTNRFGLPEAIEPDCVASHGGLKPLQRILMEAGRLNRLSQYPVVLYRHSKEGEVKTEWTDRDSDVSRRAELYIGPYFFTGLTDAQMARARLPTRFDSPFVAGLEFLVEFLLDAGWRVAPLLSWRGGLAAPCATGGLSFAYHTRGEIAGRWHYNCGHFSDIMQFDPAGYAGYSAFADRSEASVRSATADLTDQAVEERLEVYRRRYITDRFTWRVQQPPQDLSGLRGRRSTYFLPLQDPLDEVSGLAYLTPRELVDALKRELHPDDRVIVKKHPLDKTAQTDRLLTQISSDPRFVVIEASIHDVFAISDGVITVNSGVGFEALLAGLPVLAVGKSDYNLAVSTVRSADEFPATFRTFLSAVPPSWRKRVVVDYFRNFILDPADPIDFRRKLERLIKV